MGFFDKIKNDRKITDLKNISISSLSATAISGIFWFFIAKILGPENYGEIVFLISIASVASTIAMIGGNNSMTVLSGKKLGVETPLYILGMITSFIVATITYFITREPFLVIYIIGNVLFNLSIADILGKRIFSTYSKMVIFQRISMVTLSIFFYYTIGETGIILGIGTSFLIFTYKIKNSFKIQNNLFFEVRKKTRFMIHNYGTGLISILNGEIDKLLVVPLVGFVALGHYSISLQMISLAGIFTGIIFQYTLPNDAKGDENKFIKKIMILISIILSVIIIIVAPTIIPILFHEYIDSIQLVQIMSLALIPQAIQTMYTSKFLGIEKSNFVLISRSIQFSIFVVSILLLYQVTGILGIAISYVIAYTTQSISLIIFDKKESSLF